jgi:peptidoglycan/xylan/chitin deacetylase (PgdA/CDA1 family)
LEPVSVLAYRAIATKADAPWVDPRFATPLGVFEEQIAFAARDRCVLSLSQLVDSLVEQRPLPANAVVITFDGGHRSVIDRGVPILRHHQLPAILYVATEAVSQEANATNDELFALFTWRTRNVLHLPQLGPRPVSLYDKLAARSAFLALDRALAHGTWEERGHLLAETRDQLVPARNAPRSSATWSELRAAIEMHPGIEIGVSTRDHVDLTALTADAAAQEITDAVADVRKALNLEATHLSYPFNRHTYTTRAVARAVGLRSAATIDRTSRVGCHTDRFALPRIDAPGDMRSFRLLTRVPWSIPRILSSSA